MATVIAMEHWHTLYALYALRPDPPSVEALDAALPEPAWDHRFGQPLGTPPWGTLRLLDPEGRPVVALEHGPAQEELPRIGQTEGAPKAVADLLRRARSRFLISIRPEPESPVRAVQIALATASALLGRRQGVLHDLSAERLLVRSELETILGRESFVVEDHVSLHLVMDASAEEAWLHSHGMEKFGRSDLETFELDTARGRDAGRVMNQLLLSSALHTRPLVGERIEIPGGALRAVPSESMRPGVTSIPPEELLSHDGPYLCLVDADTYGGISHLVDGYQHRALSDLSNPEEEREVTRHILPLVRRHFRKNGRSEAFEYFARIPLLVRRGDRTAQESLWVKITRWKRTGLRGTLASDSMLDAQIQMGVEVAFEPEDIEAILLSAHGEPLAGRRLEKLLRS